MAYSRIDSIKIGSNPLGEGFGGYIFSANMTVGYQSAPSQLTLNIISENGSYTINKTTPKLNGSPTTILIGGLTFNMYLMGYSLSKTPQGRVLTVNYVDQSQALNRVYVGLLNEHIRKDYKTLTLEASVPVVCESCNGGTTGREITASMFRRVDSLGLTAYVGTLQKGKFGAKQSTFYYAQSASPNVASLTIIVVGTVAQMVDDTGSNLTAPSAPATPSGMVALPNLTTTILTSYSGWGRVLSNEQNPSYIFGNIQEGGFIGIGTEEFSQSVCGTGPVTYSLKELKAAIRLFGFEFATENSLDTIPDGYDDYRRPFVGSLRQVLEAWGGEYGFTFTYDFAENKIIGIDVRNPIADLDNIKTRITAADSLSNIGASPIVESLDESVSLEGTYRKYHTTNYIKQSRIKTFNRTIYNKAIFQPLTLADVIEQLPTGYNNDYDLYYKFCVLATVSRELWQAYMLNTGSLSSALGVVTVENDQKDQYLKARNLSPTFWTIQDMSPNGTKETTYDKEYNIHKTIGENFIHQWGLNLTYNPSHVKFCDRNTIDAELNAHFSKEVETFKKVGTTFPNYLPSYAKLFPGLRLRNVNSIVSRWTQFYSSSPSSANFNKRDGGRYYTQIDSSFINQIRSVAAIIIDKVDPKDYLNEQVKTHAKYKDSISVSLSGSSPNLDESIATPPQNDNTGCETMCDQDFLSEICHPNRCVSAGQRVDRAWEEGLLPNSGNNIVLGDKIIISTTTNADGQNGSTARAITITSPSYASYQMNFVYEYKTRYVIPAAKKALAGELDKTTPVNADYPGNVSQVDYSTISAASDLDVYIDSTGDTIANTLLPNGGVKTVESYDTALRNTALITASNVNPQESLKFSVAGVLDSTFSDILRPNKGLVSFDINWSEKGITTSYIYQTRPLTPPKRDLVFSRIYPTFIK